MAIEKITRVSIDQTALAISILSNNENEAQKVEISLHKIMNSLIIPTKSSNKEIERLGILN